MGLGSDHIWPYLTISDQSDQSRITSTFLQQSLLLPRFGAALPLLRWTSWAREPNDLLNAQAGLAGRLNVCCFTANVSKMPRACQTSGRFLKLNERSKRFSLPKVTFMSATLPVLPSIPKCALPTTETRRNNVKEVNRGSTEWFRITHPVRCFWGLGSWKMLKASAASCMRTSSTRAPYPMQRVELAGRSLPSLHLHLSKLSHQQFKRTTQIKEVAVFCEFQVILRIWRVGTESWEQHHNCGPSYEEWPPAPLQQPCKRTCFAVEQGLAMRTLLDGNQGRAGALPTALNAFGLLLPKLKTAQGKIIPTSLIS